jgi:acyl-[acyl-carrier-protein]-phospholipid O-acyltransferase/long-chain-fatty-acid--[acyl-carrier-protein] ligase
VPAPAFDLREGQRGLFDALLDARAKYGGKKPILEDIDRRPLTYDDLVRASFALGRRLSLITRPGEQVGVMLPSSVGVTATFFALHAIGRVPTMLNFTAGLRNLRAASRLAGLKCVLTAHRFIEQAKLHDAIDALTDEGCTVVYLEDVRAQIGLADKLYALAAGLLPRAFRHSAKPSDPGVLLFTSGSFGAPRGVMLSQGNLVSNAVQIATHIALDPAWVMFNPLPAFHCFGLTGGIILPLLNGMKAFEYPSPLHAKQIVQLLHEVQGSVLLATDTFINQYVRASTDQELTSLVFIVAGAEKVREETHNLVAERFPGVPVLEGYGATEASPVIAVNKPHDNRRGTVGGLLPGMEARLEPIAGIDAGGKLLVRGPNIMAGYLDESGAVVPPEGGWHDTGDVVNIDPNGDWITIAGRVKRFAKIGGEMVSLAAAEALASAAWPHGRHAVVSLPDARKGERLVLVTDWPEAEVGGLLAHAKAAGASELSAPRRILRASAIPVLGSGKIDYVAVQRMVEADVPPSDGG